MSTIICPECKKVWSDSLDTNCPHCASELSDIREARPYSRWKSDSSVKPTKQDIREEKPYSRSKSDSSVKPIKRTGKPEPILSQEQWGILIVLIIFGLLWLMSLSNDPKNDYEETVRLRSDRLQREMENERGRKALETRAKIDALRKDIEKNPHLYR